MSKLTRNQNSNLAEITNQMSEIHANSEFGFQETKATGYDENQSKQELNSVKK